MSRTDGRVSLHLLSLVSTSLAPKIGRLSALLVRSTIKMLGL